MPPDTEFALSNALTLGPPSFPPQCSSILPFLWPPTTYAGQIQGWAHKSRDPFLQGPFWPIDGHSRVPFPDQLALIFVAFGDLSVDPTAVGISPGQCDSDHRALDGLSRAVVSLGGHARGL